jgi:hypothetical protein
MEGVSSLLEVVVRERVWVWVRIEKVPMVGFGERFFGGERKVDILASKTHGPLCPKLRI